MGSSKRIERVYFEIKEENIEQWEKPQIKDSKRNFFFNVITEGGKETLDAFINFCEDVIFEMQLSSGLMEEEVDQIKSGGGDSKKYIADDEEEKTGMDLVKAQIGKVKDQILEGFAVFAPANLKKKIKEVKQMTPGELAVGFVKLIFLAMYHGCFGIFYIAKHIWDTLMGLMQGPPPEIVEVVEEKSGPIVPLAIVADEGGGEEEKPPEGEQLSLEGAPEEETKPKTLEELLADESISPDQALAAAKDLAEAEAATKEEAAAPAPADDAPPVANIDLSAYSKRAISFLARNFYNLKYFALILAFCINFVLLFYKATAIEEEGEGDDEGDAVSSIFGFGSGDLLGSGDEAVIEGEEAVEGSGNFTMGEDDEEEEEEEEPEEWIHMDDKYFYMEHILRIFAVTHTFVSFCMLIAYYYLKIPLVIFKREKEISRRLEFDGLYIAEQPEDDDIKAHWDKLVISAKSFPNNYWDKFVKKKVRQKYSETYDFDAISNMLGMETTMTFNQEAEPSGIAGFIAGIDWHYQIWKAGVTITDNSFLYNFWYLCFSLLGNGNYFFFAAHLMDVGVSIPSLKTILQSVTHNGKQLCLTMLLLTIVVYLYTVIAFNFFRKFYVSEEDDVVDQKCHDMLTCFVFHLYKGVRAGGGIGDEIEDPGDDDKAVYRIVFDITFFFFIIVILLAIIQGLIIDAFGELRDQLNSVSETLESNCFICGMGSDYFDSVPHGFDVHVQKEHNLANYMFFLMHLINKDDTEYTGQETYVWEMYQQRCWDFFPVGDCFRKQYEEELSGGGGGS
ncbi:unnamed protein product [Meganyctiphanes norvegica]|uniref:Ryanodine receptor n=1 Tax=Meganyctiphanes norvegica TaxID=48144 RepID=A0AAV2S0U1_MEGNR